MTKETPQPEPADKKEEIVEIKKPARETSQAPSSNTGTFTTKDLGADGVTSS